MTKLKHTIVAALIAAAFTSGALAGSTDKPISSNVSTTAKSDLTGSLEVKAVSNYVFRGQVLDSNPTFAPQLNIAYTLFDGGTWQTSVEQLIGTQGSTYFRTQYNTGLALSLGRFVVTPGFQVVAFPNRDGATTQSITARVAFNDAGLLPFALNPSVSFQKDVDPQGGSWYEAGIAPGKNLGKLEVTVPVAVGASSNSYYTYSNRDLQYAYASVGVAGVYHVTDRLSLKGSVTGYTTDTKLANASTNFVSTNVGVAVSF
jgi:hypothetical protein